MPMTNAANTPILSIAKVVEVNMKCPLFSHWSTLEPAISDWLQIRHRCAGVVVQMLARILRSYRFGQPWTRLRRCFPGASRHGLVPSLSLFLRPKDWYITPPRQRGVVCSRQHCMTLTDFDQNGDIAAESDVWRAVRDRRATPRLSFGMRVVFSADRQKIEHGSFAANNGSTKV